MSCLSVCCPHINVIFLPVPTLTDFILRATDVLRKIYHSELYTCLYHERYRILWFADNFMFDKHQVRLMLQGLSVEICCGYFFAPKYMYIFCVIMWIMKIIDFNWWIELKPFQSFCLMASYYTYVPWCFHCLNWRWGLCWHLPCLLSIVLCFIYLKKLSMIFYPKGKLSRTSFFGFLSNWCITQTKIAKKDKFRPVCPCENLKPKQSNCHRQTAKI
mgnify:CR=1 FL=1